MAMNNTTIIETAPGTTNVDEQVPAGRQSNDMVEAKVMKPAKAVKLRKSKTPAASTPASAAVLPKARPAMKIADGNSDIGIGQEAGSSRQTKADVVLKKLRATKGTTIEAMMEVTGWQAHSVRGFLSAIVRKKLGLTLVSEVGKDGIRRYRFDGDSGATG